ncbi:winged helix DNA-binding domain-containing protein [Amycolatopsis sp. EV170708-02-1]|uniref:winged helix DNA-binding domain-containing protein n=1 Tax=Amycolatopsis sp. EV170708-02-1 TaxID=2919322 RepID=UPI001F0C3EC5|nr:winged helix DNA-binding domain-containing protein [Amycolatopsis sp. EV170708-02-1]UMP00149.1 winged helix DNA-binding domain-containing protein [Amycolatopsis sp. EV170708-02-1]
MTPSDNDIRAVRARAQLLTEPAADVLTVATSVAAVQAQATPAARLAFRARSRGLTAQDVDASREVARTWLMRKTLHSVPTVDLRWLNRLFGPRNVQAGQGRRRQLGLTDELCDRALDKLQDLLPGKALTRQEILDGLAADGIALDAKSQAPAHLLAYAANRGLLCRGHDAGTEPTYVLLDEWTTEDHAPAEPHTELAHRYLTAYGIATAEDFGAWSGLPLGLCRKAFAALDLVPAGGGFALARTELTALPCPPRLLGAFDTYLLGYRDRDLLLDPAEAKRVNAGGGMIAPTVLVNGRIAGTWHTKRTAKQTKVVVEPFAVLPRSAITGLESEVDDYGRFLGETTVLVI